MTTYTAGISASQNVTISPNQTVRLPLAWLHLGQAGAAYKFIGAAPTLIDINNANYADATLWQAATNSVDLGTANYAGSDWVKLVGGAANLENLYPGIGNFTNSDARAIGILIVLNDVRSDVDAVLANANVTAGSVHVRALEDAMLLADAQINVNAQGGSFYGTGDVLAANGQLVTNLVLAGATAVVVGSHLTTSAPTSDFTTANTPTKLETGARVEILTGPLAGGVYEYIGDPLEDPLGIDLSTAGEDYTDVDVWQKVPDVLVDAESTAGIDATILSATSTGADGFGFTLAFNSIGWKAQNFLFNAVDTLLGDPLVASAFNGERSAASVAQVINSTITAAGDVQVSALNATQLNATVSNAASSVAGAMYGAKGKSVGGILASNKVSSGATATIDALDRHRRWRRDGCGGRQRRHLRERQDGLVLDHHEQRRDERPSERDQQLRRRRLPVERGHAGAEVRRPRPRRAAPYRRWHRWRRLPIPGP